MLHQFMVMQRRGAKGEAVEIYREPFVTKAMHCQGLAFGEESQISSRIIQTVGFFVRDVLF